MTNTTQNSSFKYLFWGLLFLVFIAIAGQVMWIVFRGLAPIPFLIGADHNGAHILGQTTRFARLLPMAIMTIVSFFVWVSVVGTLTFRDAKKRGMDPYLWASVAVFLPFFIGIIIYLVVRSNGKTPCGNCGQPISSDYKVCPYCSHRHELLCPGCNKPIKPEWKVCPYCEHKPGPVSE